MAEIEAGALAHHLTARTASGIAQDVKDLVQSEALYPGTRLPALPEVADQVRVGMGTIAEAWSVLYQRNPLITRRRSGGVASNSRILQHTNVAMIKDRKVQRAVKTAGEHYAIRQELALMTFAEQGLRASSGAGSLAQLVSRAEAGTLRTTFV